jgi:hypothetical protein
VLHVEKIRKDEYTVYILLKKFNIRKHLELQSKGKGKVIPVVGQLSTTPGRLMEERLNRSTCS